MAELIGCKISSQNLEDHGLLVLGFEDYPCKLAGYGNFGRARSRSARIPSVGNLLMVILWMEHCNNFSPGTAKSMRLKRSKSLGIAIRGNRQVKLVGGPTLGTDD